MENTKAEERRKYPRFSDRILAGATVDMKPVPPLFGDPVSGYLIDLSAGGMAIVIPDLIPKNVFLRMTMVLPDGFKLESVVTVRRIIKQGRGTDYLHGIEFLNPSPEMVEHIGKMATDILACNDRTKQEVKDICVDTCRLRQICKRPQCAVKNIQPALIQLTQELKDQTEKTESDWLAVKAQFKKFLHAA